MLNRERSKIRDTVIVFWQLVSSYLLTVHVPCVRTCAHAGGEGGDEKYSMSIYYVPDSAEALSVHYLLYNVADTFAIPIVHGETEGADT